MAASSPASIAIQTRCPPLISYSKEFMTKAAEELDKLPFGSPTVQLINDYQRMRDICRKINLP